MFGPRVSWIRCDGGSDPLFVVDVCWTLGGSEVSDCWFLSVKQNADIQCSRERSLHGALQRDERCDVSWKVPWTDVMFVFFEVAQSVAVRVCGSTSSSNFLSRILGCSRFGGSPVRVAYLVPS